MSDRSLDEFANVDADADGDDEGDAEPTARTPEPSPAPATPTMRWSTDPVACDACGTTVSRRWRDTAARPAASSRPSADDGESSVCADCKEW